MWGFWLQLPSSSRFLLLPPSLSLPCPLFQLAGLILKLMIRFFQQMYDGNVLNGITEKEIFFKNSLFRLFLFHSFIFLFPFLLPPFSLISRIIIMTTVIIITTTVGAPCSRSSSSRRRSHISSFFFLLLAMLEKLPPTKFK